MFRIFFFVFFTSTGITTIAQVDSIPAEAKSFILPGYEPKDYEKGDLNADKRIDAILVLKRIGEDSLYDINTSAEDTSSESEILRPFIILIRQADGKLKQVLRNDHVIMCRRCGGVFGDPYEGINIHPGGFNVYFYGGSSWRWAQHYYFSYKAAKKNWYLVKFFETSFHMSDPEKATDLTIPEAELGEIPVEKFDVESDWEGEEVKWKVIAAKTYFYDNPKLGSKPRKGYLVKGDIVSQMRQYKNFVQVTFSDEKGVYTSGFILKKDLVKVQ